MSRKYTKEMVAEAVWNNFVGSPLYCEAVDTFNEKASMEKLLSRKSGTVMSTGNQKSADGTIARLFVSLF